METITVEIDTEFIPATALLKLAGITDSGGQASFEIEQGHVFINGTVLKEKRKKIRPGDKLNIRNEFEIYIKEKHEN